MPRPQPRARAKLSEIGVNGCREAEVANTIRVKTKIGADRADDILASALADERTSALRRSLAGEGQHRQYRLATNCSYPPITDIQTGALPELWRP